MQVLEVIEGVTRVWSRKGGTQTRKYRCTSGIRKGQVRSSPAACNAPLNIRKSTNLKRTKHRRGARMAVKSQITKRVNPASTRLRTLNKPKKPGGRKI